MVFIFGFSATFFWFLVYTFKHLKEIFSVIFQKDKSNLNKRIKRSLSPKYTKLAIKIVDSLNKLFLKFIIARHLIKKDRLIKEKDIKKWEPFEKKLWHIYYNLEKHIIHCYIPLYFIFAVILDLITFLFVKYSIEFFEFKFNFLYILLIYIGIICPIIWIIEKIVFSIDRKYLLTKRT